MEGFNHYPACFQRACPYLIARIIYQCNHPDSNQNLFEKLDKRHPLWNQRLFASPATVDGKIYRNGYSALKDYVVCGYGRCEDTGMRATGLPSHFILANEVRELTQKIQKLEERQERMEKIITSIPKELSSKLPGLCVQEMMGHFKVEGVLPLNMQDIRNLLDERNEQLMGEIQKINLKESIVGAAEPQEHTTTSNSSEHENFNTMGELFELFEWGNPKRKCYVPEGFEFPRGADSLTMWKLWHFGNTHLKIRPYKGMEAYKKSDLDGRGRERYSRAARIMGMIDEEVERQELVSGGLKQIRSLSPEEASSVFMKAFEAISPLFYPNGNTRAALSVSIDHLCNILSEQNKKRKAARLECTVPRDVIAEALLSVGPIENVVC